VGGVTPLTTIDLPGELAAVVFCQGCPWRCRYCHNPGLLPAGREGSLAWEDLLGFLKRRKALLDGVVFSGGEPTLQAGLGNAMAQVRALGFRVGLHTAGCYPDRLQRVLPQVDWVGLDIKTLPEHYPGLTSVPASGEAAWESLSRVLGSGVPYEVRVTIDPDLLPPDRLDRLLRRLARTGVRYLALQASHAGRERDPVLVDRLQDNTKTWGALFEDFVVR
jgi:pyruvate formate lyase activating enzyme